MRLTFRGGVHPDESKELTRGQPTRALEPPARVVIPVRQHSGAPAKPVVKVGDLVAEGQPVAEAVGAVSAPCHASIAGRVAAVGPHLHPSGFVCEAVTIEALASPPSDTSWPPAPWRLADPLDDYLHAEPDELRGRIRAAGIIGLGGAGFPTHVKLSPPKNKPIDTLIVNGVECEPYLTCDHRAMLEQADDIVHGVRILRRILGVGRALFGIEANKPDAFEAMRHAFSDDPAVQVVSLPVKYPQGGEKQLIKALTGREVPPRPGLPMDVGCVVQNVSTTAAIARAVVRGLPLYERVVTLNGSLLRRPGNYRVRLGTLLSELVEAAGGLKAPPARVVMGGPMMGLAQTELAVPIVKSVSGFVFLSKRELPALDPYPCIRCGRCIAVCPLGLDPTRLAQLVERGELEAAEALHLRDCQECASCSYICPSNRWLVQQIRLGKAKLDERKQKPAI